MSLLRIAAPGKPTKVIDLGPAHGERRPYEAMRKTIDDLPKHVGRNHATHPS